MNLKHILFPFLFVIFLFACTSTRQGVTEGNSSRAEELHTVTVVQNPTTLADILVRLPGVFVDERYGGTLVKVRGGYPLFVLDGIPLGNSYYSAASAVNVFDIAKVELLTSPTQTSYYGRRAAHGVILITTKSA